MVRTEVHQNFTHGGIIIMRINHNITALNTHRQLIGNNGAQSKSVEKLSSGFRINRAGDDAAGLSISEKMRSQIRGMNQASRNAQDGISLIQTAEGALNETHSILNRMRELAVQSANGTNATEDRDALQLEVDALTLEVDRIANSTKFNGLNLLNAPGTLTLQIGANATADDRMDITLNSMQAATLGVDAVLVDNQANCYLAITDVDAAIQTVSNTRSGFGALQNRLEHTIANIDNTAENLQAAESRIRDVDMAKEMMEFTKNNILVQSATAMLAQANQQPQSVLQLLR